MEQKANSPSDSVKEQNNGINEEILITDPHNVLEQYELDVDIDALEEYLETRRIPLRRIEIRTPEEQGIVRAAGSAGIHDDSINLYVPDILDKFSKTLKGIDRLDRQFGIDTNSSATTLEDYTKGYKTRDRLRDEVTISRLSTTLTTSRIKEYMCNTDIPIERRKKTAEKLLRFNIRSTLNQTLWHEIAHLDQHQEGTLIQGSKKAWFYGKYQAMVFIATCAVTEVLNNSNIPANENWAVAYLGLTMASMYAMYILAYKNDPNEIEANNFARLSRKFGNANIIDFKRPSSTGLNDIK